VRALYSGVSPGTERLVGLGRVPSAAAESMDCRYMAGDFALPVKYGYCLVAEGLEGGLEGQRLFVMHPHQELAVVRDEHAVPLPDSVPSRRAVLIPNLETALNAIWDAELGEATEPCLVVGGGVVGLLVAYVLRRTHDRPLAIVEPHAGRRERATSLPWIDEALTPEDVARGEAAVAFHASGDPRGLQTALDAVGFEGRVVDLSWYGDRAVTLDLGTAFHRQRKRILASQVSSVAPSHRASHGHAGRMREVISLLDDPALEALLGAPVPFSQMPAYMAELYRDHVEEPLPLISYESS
jgi:threonine dehydrogenase-like Zn-dependent dehydrogenase